MRLFLTGATGFIGSHLTRRLVNEGHEIVALVRNPDKARGLPDERIHLIKGDFELFKDPQLMLPPADVVIHLAGVVTAPRLEDYARYNYEAVQDLIACLKRQDWRPRRILFASSLAASGPSDPERPHTETMEPKPNEPYGQSKLDAERYLEAHAPCPVTSFRPGAVYGPGDPAFLTVFKMAARGYGFKVAGIDPQFSYVYVEDLVDALVRLMEDSAPTHRTYFTTHPQNATINEMWDEFRRVLQRNIHVVPVPKQLLYLLMLGGTAASKVLPFKNQLDFKQYQQITVPAFACSSAALMKDFDWAPQHDLAKSIEKTATGYREAGWL